MEKDKIWKINSILIYSYKIENELKEYTELLMLFKGMKENDIM